MKEQFMVVCNANSGSDWLSPILARRVASGPQKYWQKEFFNPITNNRFAEELSPVFPSESAIGYENFGVRLTDDLIQRVLNPIYRKTWAQLDYTFNKEAYTPNFTRWYASKFNVVGLVRTTEDLFPPTKARTWATYETMWLGLRKNGWVLFHSESMKSRAMEAHRVMREFLMQELADIGAPVLHYETMVSGSESEVTDEARRIGWLDVEGFVQDVMESRDSDKAARLAKISAYA